MSTPKHRPGKVDLEKLQNNVLITVSEFRIRFSNVLLMQLRHTKFKLKELIDTEKDSLRFYNLGDKYTNRIEHYGAKSAIKVEEPLIF